MLEDIKILNSVEELVGKKIIFVAMQDNYDYGFRNIFVTEDKEVLLYRLNVDYDEIEVYDSSDLIYRLINNEKVRDKLLELKVITQEDYDEIIRRIKIREKNENNSQKKLRYKQYLELKNEFDKEGDTDDDNSTS